MGRHAPKVPDDLMPLEEAAKFLGIAPGTLKNRSVKGRIRKWKITPGSKPFYSREDLLGMFHQVG